jgi:hypothetical protein
MHSPELRDSSFWLLVFSHTPGSFNGKFEQMIDSVKFSGSVKFSKSLILLDFKALAGAPDDCYHRSFPVERNEKPVLAGRVHCFYFSLFSSLAGWENSHAFAASIFEVE